MDPTRWQRMERLYQGALARPVAERAAHLAEACAGDETLRRDVQSLLDSPATAEGFLAAPALAVAAQMVSDPAVTALTGGRLGVYHLQERMGIGFVNRDLAFVIGARSRRRAAGLGERRSLA